MADQISGKDIVTRVVQLLLAVVVIALIMRASVATSYAYWFWMLLMLAIPLAFIVPKPLTMKYAVAYWIIFAIIHFGAWYSPGIYDGTLSRIAFTDYVVGDFIRASEDDEASVITGTDCRKRREKVNKQYAASLAKINQSLDTAQQIELAKAAKAISEADHRIIDGYCKQSGAATSSTPSPVAPSNPSTPSAPVQTGGNEVFVDATLSSGVPSVSLKSGSKFRIQGSGTAVWKNIPVGNPTKYEECGPSGTSPTGSPLMSKGEYFSNINDYLCPTALKGALIARVGNGAWFPVGKNYQGVTTRDGQLVLAVNDVDPAKQPLLNWNDNSKGFQATVTVY